MRTESISINPADGTLLGRYPAMDGAQLDAALARASAGFRNWAALGQDARCTHLQRLGAVLASRREELARSITLEMGKPISLALAEVDKCANLCNWYAENSGQMLADETTDFGPEGVATVRYLPLGTVLAVMPWNFPIWQVLRAAVPIMASGNALLLKHADNVQGSAHALAECFSDAGFPDGAFLVVNADREAITGLLGDPRICGVTVTAGVAAGSALASEAGRNLKKSLLELGGSDPFIVLPDANLERATTEAVRARFQNCGQVCIAAKRFLIHEEIFDAFTDSFVEKVRQIRVGDPLDAKTEMGPMAREHLRAEVHSLVTRSIDHGARVLLGGEIADGPGAFYPPTVLVDVTNDMPVCREEVFGPVAPILKVRSFDAAIELANDSLFGLSASVWTGDPDLAARNAPRINAGAVYVNGISVSDPRVPIGGIKASGYGRELSHFGLKEFCNAQLCWLR
ncbi:succinate-semialdehyde dehydrogenase [Altererythrobacter atlanticus]|uniref:Succinate semialdehyde dehydrogenase [NAD(P)+] Sad n=1 Tax=Croceibacterium atlanticum TaxID=1267766 RepID=A0A0F7KUQ3_9SPHN|nr:NAD-dependent succinate-semialdehyde dehydrogenase [Croceibacterium atlanticum]AKH42891.1 Succinate semialdehyde dehydrogenase [NAD(P)+] Sad [Croceibacterium atlanticum]MBB5731671.1 succinate-semialdehyde dehydrogenase [Croceibacterium atlanticum]